METKYSKEPFEDYTHRFIVKFKVDDDWRNDTNIQLYSNSGSYRKLHNFLTKKKSEKVIRFDIEHRATKEQDEMASKFINDILTDKELKTSKEWYDLVPKVHNLTILDPDGWDRTNYDYSFNEELISNEEFKKRVSNSTVMCNTTFFTL